MLHDVRKELCIGRPTQKREIVKALSSARTLNSTFDPEMSDHDDEFHSFVMKSMRKAKRADKVAGFKATMRSMKKRKEAAQRNQPKKHLDHENNYSSRAL